MSTAPYANDGISDNRGAFNTGDNNYYAFRHDWFDTGHIWRFDTLLKISTAGMVTYLAPSAPGLSSYRDALYSQATNKLYCVRDSSLCEIAIAGSTYSVTPVATDTVYRISAIDNAGYIYYVARHKICKVLPGSPSTVIATIPASTYGIHGLCYNNNDNKLYGIADDGIASGSVDRFVRIDPVSGSITTLSTFGFFFNFEFYSAVIDECSNRYILSSDDGMGPFLNSSYLKQIDMSGVVVQTNSMTDGIYLDMAIH